MQLQAGGIEGKHIQSALPLYYRIHILREW